jgi:hypothetical protein
VDEARYNGFAEFSDARFAAALWLFWRLPSPYRLVITDGSVLIEARWGWLRSLLSTRSRDLREMETARLRGTLVLLTFADGASFSTALHCRNIIEALESRGIAVMIDK